jgi:hypothetical protein
VEYPRRVSDEPRRIDVVLAPDYLEGLEDQSLDDVRARHEECMEIETEVSYVRRLAQARMEILRAEQNRRANGGSVADLVAALPSILADAGPRGNPATSRLTRHLAPAPDIQWTRGSESLIADDTLANLPMLSDDELREALEGLTELERDVSARRRELHAVIDQIEVDLARRQVSA